MSYFTERKKKSQRRRRRIPIVFKAADVFLDDSVRTGRMTWTEYKIMRQYFNDFNRHDNGHDWIDRDLPDKK